MRLLGSIQQAPPAQSTITAPETFTSFEIAAPCGHRYEVDDTRDVKFTVFTEFSGRCRSYLYVTCPACAQRFALESYTGVVNPVDAFYAVQTGVRVFSNCPSELPCEHLTNEMRWEAFKLWQDTER